MASGTPQKSKRRISHEDISHEQQKSAAKKARTKAKTANSKAQKKLSGNTDPAKHQALQDAADATRAEYIRTQKDYNTLEQYEGVALPEDPPRFDVMSVDDNDALSLVGGSPSANDLMGDTMTGVFRLLRDAADPARVTPSEEAFHVALEGARLGSEEWGMANKAMATILSTLGLLSESKALCRDFKSKYETTLGVNTGYLATIAKLKVDLQTAEEQAAASPARAKEKTSFSVPDWEAVQFVRVQMLAVALQVPRVCLMQKDTPRFTEEFLLNLWADNFEALENILLERMLTQKFTKEKWKCGISSCTSQIASCFNGPIVLWFGTLFGLMSNNKLDGKSSKEIVSTVKRVFHVNLEMHEETGLAFREKATDKMSLLPANYNLGVILATQVNKTATHGLKESLGHDARAYTGATGSGRAFVNAANTPEHVDKLKQSVVKCFPDFDTDMVAATLANVLMAVLTAPKETKLPEIMSESGILSCKNHCETKVWYAMKGGVLVQQVKDDAPEPKKVANKAAGEAADEAAGEAAGEAADEAAGEAADEAADEAAGEAADEAAGEAADEVPMDDF